MIDLGAYNFTYHTLMIGVYSHIVLFGVGYLASLGFPQTKDTDDLTYVGWLQKKGGKAKRPDTSGKKGKADTITL